MDYEVSQASAQINTLREELIINEYDKAIAMKSIAREQRQIDVERYVYFCPNPPRSTHPYPPHEGYKCRIPC